MCCDVKLGSPGLGGGTMKDGGGSGCLGRLLLKCQAGMAGRRPPSGFPHGHHCHSGLAWLCSGGRPCHGERAPSCPWTQVGTCRCVWGTPCHGPRWMSVGPSVMGACCALSACSFAFSFGGKTKSRTYRYKVTLQFEKSRDKNPTVWFAQLNR